MCLIGALLLVVDYRTLSPTPTHSTATYPPIYHHIARRPIEYSMYYMYSIFELQWAKPTIIQHLQMCCHLHIADPSPDNKEFGQRLMFHWQFVLVAPNEPPANLPVFYRIYLLYCFNPLVNTRACLSCACSPSVAISQRPSNWCVARAPSPIRSPCVPVSDRRMS